MMLRRYMMARRISLGRAVYLVRDGGSLDRVQETEVLQRETRERNEEDG